MEIRFRKLLICLAVVGLSCAGCTPFGPQVAELEIQGVSRVGPSDYLPGIRLSWAPSGGSIAVSSQVSGGDMLPVGKIYILDLLAGKLHLLLEARNAYRWVQSWSPDGTEIAFSTTEASFSYRSDQGIWVINSDGSGEPRFLGGGYLAAWSPTGRKIAICECTADPDAASIWIVDLESGERQLVFSRPGSGSFGWRLSWSPDGTMLAFAFRAVTPQEGYPYRDIYTLDLKTGDLNQLTHGGDNEYPTWSPDGRLIAYSILAQDFSSTVIMIARADGSCGVVALSVPGVLDDPAWSPDGRQIAFARDGGIYLMDVAVVLGDDFLTTAPVCP
jgi:Tol biopolymer transport system component